MSKVLAAVANALFIYLLYIYYCYITVFDFYAKNFDVIILLFCYLSYFSFLTKFLGFIGGGQKIISIATYKYYYFYKEAFQMIVLLWVNLLYYNNLFHCDIAICSILFFGVLSFFYCFFSENFFMETSRLFGIMFSLIMFNQASWQNAEYRLLFIISAFIYFGCFLKLVFNKFLIYMFERINLTQRRFHERKFFVFVLKCAINLLFNLVKIKSSYFFTKIFYVFLVFLFPFLLVLYVFNYQYAIYFFILQFHIIYMTISVYNLLITDINMFFLFYENLSTFDKNVFSNKFIEIIKKEQDKKTSVIAMIVLVSVMSFFDDLDKKIGEKAHMDARDVVGIKMKYNRNVFFLMEKKKELVFKPFFSSYYNIILVVTPGLLNLFFAYSYATIF